MKRSFSEAEPESIEYAFSMEHQGFLVIADNSV
ncbi:MAG TPA: hypothetical protein DEB17_08515 [Chlorobaculum sp.]|uniref:Uncharacterized protein n=1 Tax=Chlorobaculum tepidum (strain ATCC 49652 / DSM 12025 / NBRC 103806 / TLS) TaxID=194439 RepID=Q8KEZ9_CHLTE|nr:hypothetical protein CT0533 [Chlorobaculum tepidum TLS]HBU24013.1 hypothetical protein [Chlorobaculum sp.]